MISSIAARSRNSVITEEVSFYGFRKGCGTRDTVATLHVLHEGNLEHNSTACLIR